MSEDEIMALLACRPCTVRGVAEGLGLHPAEAIKLLDDMAGRGRVRTVQPRHLDCQTSSPS